MNTHKVYLMFSNVQPVDVFTIKLKQGHLDDAEESCTAQQNWYKDYSLQLGQCNVASEGFQCGEGVLRLRVSQL